jgi:hypothetical protein
LNRCWFRLSFPMDSWSLALQDDVVLN